VTALVGPSLFDAIPFDYLLKIFNGQFKMSSNSVAMTAVVFSVCTSIGLAIALLRRQRSTLNLEADPSAKDRQYVLSKITEHQDFPKKGILFRDIFPVMRDPSATQALIRLLHQRIKTLGKVDVIVGLESRGFLFGPILALLCNAAFTPVRKPGKLPGKLTSMSYEKEYGTDTFEIQTECIRPGARVVIFDDLIATGGSLFAATNLVEQLGGKVVECVLIIELAGLQGIKNVPAPVWSLYQF
jgi:adenine phosphoribosyltransferase